MQPRYLIIGQGIAGTLLSYMLWKNNRSFLVIDEPGNIPKASLVAGAVINPVNVNRWTIKADHRHYTREALETYQSMEETLGVSLVREMAMLVFHEDGHKRQLYDKAQLLQPGYVQQPDHAETILSSRLFRHEHGVGKVAPVWKVNAGELLSAWSGFLKNKGLLIQEYCKAEECKPTSKGIRYKDIIAEKIIFCEGAAAAHNPFFSKLPFNRNRGEALLLSVPDLPADYAYHYNIRLVPAEGDLFWCGSNYRWQFDNLLPDQGWRSQTETVLRQWLTVPFKVIDHLVAERPTTAGQHFFAGIHPTLPSVAIFNGLGTKGFSYGPALSRALYRQLIDPDQPNASPGAPLQHWLK